MFKSYDRRKQPYYLDFIKLDNACRFTKMNDDNSRVYVTQLNDYINAYPHNIYAYLLAKKFILGLSFSINESKESPHSNFDPKKILQGIMQIINFVSHSNFYGKDTQREKIHVQNAANNILNTLGIFNIEIAKDPIDSQELIAEMEKLNIGSSSHNFRQGNFNT